MASRKETLKRMDVRVRQLCQQFCHYVHKFEIENVYRAERLLSLQSYSNPQVSAVTCPKINIPQTLLRVEFWDLFARLLRFDSARAKNAQDSASIGKCLQRTG